MALIGKFSETPFTDLIQFYTASKQTVAVTVSLTDGRGDDGVFYIEDGDVVDAWLGEAVGRDAVRRALRLGGGSFRVEPNIRAAERTIAEPWKQLLFEELVQLDEENRQKKNGAAGPETAPAAAPAPVAPAPVVGAPATPGAAPAPGQKNPKVLVAAAAAVALLAVGAYLILKPGGAKKPEGGAATPAAGAPSAASAAEAQARAEAAAREAARNLPVLTFGMVSPLNGANKELGLGMKAGLELAFEAANDAGGVAGHRLQLLALDDGNEPARTAEGMKDLVESRKVFAVVGNAGASTMAAATSIANQRKVPLIGALGVGQRKQPPDRYVFVYRPSLGEETAAAVRYLIEVRKVPAASIAVFAQDDEWGEAGWKGALEQLKAHGQAPEKALRVSYKRNSADVGDAVKKLKAFGDLKAVVMVATYAPATRLIERVLDVAPETIFTNVSTVDVAAVAEELIGSKVPLKDNVVVTQVVPLAGSRAPGVAAYRTALERNGGGEAPSALSLEGWVVGQLVIEALKAAGPKADAEALVAALEKLHVDIGLGVPLGFSPSDHQASRKVWGASLEPSGEWKQIDLP